MAKVSEGGQMSYGINHQVGIKATPDDIYRALAETEKLAQWRTIDTRGSGAKVGDTLEFWFNKASFCQQFNVKELEPGKRVVWKSPKGQGADQWEGPHAGGRPPHAGRDAYRGTADMKLS